MTIAEAKAALRRRRRRVKVRKQQLKGARRKVEQAKRRLARVRDRIRRENLLWGGSRAVTNEVIGIVNGRARITSRKRAKSDPLSINNPGSDHSAENTLADAVDFGIAEAHWLKNEIARKLTNGRITSLADFGTFNITRNGHVYRVQIIAGTHGTGPHLHVGVKRVG